GFNIMLGNPPWAVSQYSASEDEEESSSGSTGSYFSKRTIECQNSFFRSSTFFPNSTTGKLNYYTLFAERFCDGINAAGRAGFIVPTGLVTDDSSGEFFRSLMQSFRIVSFVGFENEEFI